MNWAPLSVATVVVCLAVAASCSSRPPVEKKSYTFRGKVEAIDKKKNNLTVKGEKVDGWMDAMTMDYKVDDPSVLGKLSPGDQVTATVYDGDEKLHQVQVVGPNSEPKK
jgi:protein SCO1/2